MHLLRQPRLALLFAGGALNAIGSWATLIALWGFAAYRFHTGPSGIAMIGLAWNVPGAAVGPFAGWPIDRFGPRAVMIASDLLGLVTALGMAASNSYGALVALAVASGTVQSFGRPASMSLIPRIVDEGELLAGNSFMGVAEQSAIVFGPLAGSLAINAWGIRAAFIFDAATFAVGALSIVPLKLRAGPRASTGAGFNRRDLVAGWQLARRIPDVRRTLGLAFAVFCSWGAFLVIEPLYVRDVLHRSPSMLGLFQTVFGVGLIGTTMLLPRIGDRVVSVKALAIAVAFSGLAAAVYVGTRSLPVAMTGVFVWGVDVAFFMPPMQTVLQRATPVEAHGRIMSLAATADGIGSLIAIPMAGVLAAAWGVSRTGLTVGSLAVLTGLVGTVIASSGRNWKGMTRAGRTGSLPRGPLLGGAEAE
ncbi:MAG TPA: MFS transporter [Acidimicrobiales bacterium]|nr:MFS transporter [Acidimicrobiales bacterium]